MSLKEILKKLLLWRLLIFIPALLGMWLVTARNGYSLQTDYFSWPNFALIWSNFDGIHYMDIAKFGYGVAHHTDMSYAFFPVYPSLVKFFALFNSYIFGGLFVSHLALLFSVYFLYKLLRLDFSEKISKLTLLLMATFPTAFFFGSVYTESVFLLLTVLTFYLARQKHWWLAALLAAIASATRVTGILLWPALLIEYLFYTPHKSKNFFAVKNLWVFLPPLGLLLFMNMQQVQTGDPLYFFHSQAAFHAGRTVNKIILIHQVIFRYLKMLVFVDHTTPLFFAVLLEFLSGIGFLALSIYGLVKLRKTYAFYTFVSFIVPTLTGTFLSTPRFVLVLFPLFALFAQILTRHPRIIKPYLFIASIMAAITIILFTRGYFVS